MKKKQSFAIVGLGHIGKRHAAIIHQHPDCELVAICDVDANKQKLADEYNVPFYTDLGEMLALDFAVLSIATPNSFHATQAISALQHNKHVIIEKPMTLTNEDALNVIQTANDYQKKVFCVMQNRYSPTAIWLKNVMDSQILGDIFHVQINCFWNRDERYYTNESWHGKKPFDGGPLFTQFSHFIDILFWLFGGISDIQGHFYNFNHQKMTDYEDSGDVLFSFENGGKGGFHYSTSVWDTNLESSISIIAEKGSIKVGGQYMNEVLYCHIQDYLMPELPAANPPNDYGAYKGSAANHHYIYENVVNVLNTGASIDIPAKDGQSVVEMIENMYKSKIKL